MARRPHFYNSSIFLRIFAAARQSRASGGADDIAFPAPGTI